MASSEVSKVHDIREMLEMAMKMEQQAISDYNQWANECSANADSASKKIFEDLVADREKFFRKICETMGVNAEEGIQLVEKNVDNSRWTTTQIEALDLVAGSPLRSFHFRFASKRTRRKVLGLNKDGTPAVSGERARASFSPEWQEKIFETTRKH